MAKARIVLCVLLIAITPYSTFALLACSICQSSHFPASYQYTAKGGPQM